MAKFSLSRPDTQARVGALISLASCLGLVALAILVFRHMDWGQWIITYGKGRYQLIGVVGALTILMAAIGFGMGWSSAGQRRNEKPVLSWVGFFVGASVICLAVVLLYVINVRGEQVVL
jgi:hypothetical protein